jgi:predicted small lipoprotein YifL
MIRGVLVCLLLLLSTACGQKGDLYLPEDRPAEATGQED